jgi:hypothetical protein
VLIERIHLHEATLRNDPVLRDSETLVQRAFLPSIACFGRGRKDPMTRSGVPTMAASPIFARSQTMRPSGCTTSKSESLTSDERAARPAAKAVGSRSPSEGRINELGEGRSLYMTMCCRGAR